VFGLDGLSRPVVRQSQHMAMVVSHLTIGSLTGLALGP
jgi:hypothetical protein